MYTFGKPKLRTVSNFPRSEKKRTKERVGGENNYVKHTYYENKKSHFEHILRRVKKQFIGNVWNDLPVSVFRNIDFPRLAGGLRSTR